MSIEEIRKNAPPTASHYYKSSNGIHYCKLVRNELWTFDANNKVYKTYGNITIKPL